MRNLFDLWFLLPACISRATFKVVTVAVLLKEGLVWVIFGVGFPEPIQECLDQRLSVPLQLRRMDF